MTLKEYDAESEYWFHVPLRVSQSATFYAEETTKEGIQQLSI